MLHKTEDIVPVFYGPALALWQPVPVFADMNSVALAGNLLVWPLAATDPAIACHSSSFRFQSEDDKPGPMEKRTALAPGQF